MVALIKLSDYSVSGVMQVILCYITDDFLKRITEQLVESVFILKVLYDATFEAFVMGIGKAILDIVQCYAYSEPVCTAFSFCPIGMVHCIADEASAVPI